MPIRIAVASQLGQRRTTPAPRYARWAASGCSSPQAWQTRAMAVGSTARISPRRPATPLPSRCRSVISSSRGAEALGVDLAPVVAELDQQVGDLLDEPGGAADEAARARARRRPDLGEQLAIDAPRRPGPAIRRRAGEGPGHVEARARLEPLELVAEERVGVAARRDEQVRLDVAAGGGGGAQHGHQGRDARAAGDEEDRPAVRGLPAEVAADRAANLELVARPDLLDQVRRDLAVVDELDGDLQRVELGRRGDRVRALRLVAVLGGQPDVAVLPRPGARPVGDVERQGARPRRLGDDLAPRRGAPGEPPGQSPQYRCSRHGSPWLW